MRDRVVAREPELHPPSTHIVLDWMLCGLFLLFDLRLKYAADRGGVRHVVWAGDFFITWFGYLFFEQALDWRAILGLLLIVAGGVLVSSLAPTK